MKSMIQRPTLKSTALVALVALNALLVMVLVLRHTPENRAQAAGNINASEILAVPGKLPGFSNGVVFLIDTRTNNLTAVSYDSPTQRLQAMNPLDLSKQLNAAPPARGK